MSFPSTVNIFLLDDAAVTPQRYDGIGYDLSSIEEGNILSGQVKIFGTGVSIAIQDSDCYGRVAPRSGLAAKHGIDVLAGVIDPSYRGEIKVILVNHGPDSVFIAKGSRIAQLIFEKAYTPSITVVSSKEELGSTRRDDKGFGSSGL